MARLSRGECAKWLDRQVRGDTAEHAPSRAHRDRPISSSTRPGTQHSSLFPSYLTKDLSQGDRVEPDGNQAARHQHSGRRRDLRQQRGRHRRARRLLPERKGEAAASGADAYHALHHQRPEDSRDGCRRGIRAARTSRNARRSAAGADRTLRGWRQRPARRVESADAVSGIVRDAAPPPAAGRVAVRCRLAQQAEPVCPRDAARRAFRISPSTSLSFTPPIPIWTTRSCSRCRSRSQNLRNGSIPPGRAFVQALAEREFDYAALFESSGMYRGEDLVSVISPLMSGRLDAVWGSRRLSLKDIEASYRLRYNHKALLGSLQLHRQPPAERGVPHCCSAAISPTRCPACERCGPEFLTSSSGGS